MSWRVEKEPDLVAPAYEQDSLVYKWANDFTITSAADNAGQTRLTMSDTTWNGVVQPDDKVYLSFLNGFDEFDSAVVTVTAIDVPGGTIDVELDWNVDFGTVATSATLHSIKTETFIVLTGYGTATATNQPTRTNRLRISGGVDGFYTLNVAQFVWSRFNYEEPPTAIAKFNSIVEYYAYPEEGTTPDLLYAIKQTEGTQGQRSLIYDNLEGFINYVRVDPDTGIDIYAEVPEAPADASYGSEDGDLQVLGMAGCKTYRVLFTTNLLDSDTVITPSGFFSDPNRSLITEDSGQTITGFEITPPSGSGVLDVELNEDNGIDPPVVYNFRIYYRPCKADTTIRNACAEGVHLIWWHPEGGWCQYQFRRLVTHGFRGGSVVLQQINNTIKPVEYDDSQQTLTLRADIESEDIFDYLNSIARSLQVFWKQSGKFVRVYPEDGRGIEKQNRPYLATSNRWTMRFNVSEIEARIKQSR